MRTQNYSQSKQLLWAQGEGRGAAVSPGSRDTIWGPQGSPSSGRKPHPFPHNLFQCLEWPQKGYVCNPDAPRDLVPQPAKVDETLLRVLPIPEARALMIQLQGLCDCLLCPT